MESVFRHEVWERKVSVVGAELLDKYTVYIIDVTDGRHRWTVKHRYSDFHDLHEKMTAEKKVDRRLLPPKKILGKNSRSLVERRQKELELYLQTLLLQFPEATPPPLSCFLDFHLYEINGITAALAEDLFHRGEQLLMAGQVFCLRPVQLYSVSQQLRLAKPTCFNGDARTDLGHILDFTCRLRYLKVCGSRGPVGTSNIQESGLPFDLSVFKSLQQIEISDCSSQQIGGLSSLRSSLVTMSVHRSTESMMSILVPEAIEFSQWEPEGGDSGCPVTAIIPVWRHLTTLDMSHNCIHAIDGSVKLIPKVEFLDLSYNQLSLVENLQHLYNLVHVDLSYNGLRILEAAHTRLGNIKTLNLSGNQLEELSGLSKLYSLVNLDLSHNRLAQLEEIRNISCLPCLEKLNMSSNPICIIPDYRTKVLAQFGERAAEVCLDSRVTTEKELDTVEVLKAIRKAKEVKEVKDRMSSSDKKVSEDTRPSSTCPSQQAASSSPEVTSGEEVPVLPVVLPPLFPAPPLHGSNTLTHLPSTHTAKVQQPTTDRFEGPYRAPTSSTLTAVCSICSSSSRPCWSCSATWCPLLPSSLFYLSSSNKDFISQLSQHLSSTVWDRRKKKDEEKEEQRSKVRGQSNVEDTQVGSPRTGSRDGYFEMGLEDSVEEMLGSSPRFLPAVVPEESSVGTQKDEEKEGVRVSGVLWCCCVRVDPEELKQSRACLVLTDQLLGLLHLPDHFTGTSQGAELLQDPVLEDVMSSLQLDLLVPYSQILVSSSPQLLGSFLSFGLRATVTRWYIFSGPEELQKTRTELGTLLQNPPELLTVPQLLTPSLLNFWELEECQGAQGGLPVFLQFSSEPRAPLQDISSEHLGLPCLVFLTHRHLWILKMDLAALADKEGVQADHHQSSGSKLVQVPLISLALHPRHRPGYRLCLDPQHQHRSPHSVELFISTQKLLMVFPLVQDQTRFLAELDHQRTSLKGWKMLVLPQPCRPCPHPGQERPCPHPGQERPCPHLGQERPCPHPGQERPCPHPGEERPCPHPGQERPCPHPVEERPRPYPVEERPCPHPGEERPCPHPVEERPCLHPGQERPCLHPGEERPCPHPGEERPCPHLGQERPCPHPVEERPCPHPGEERPCPYPGQERPCPHLGQERPCPHPVEERPCPHPGEERPCPHPGEERPCPHPGEERPCPYPGEERPCPHPGEERPCPHPGQERPCPHLVEERPRPHPGEERPCPHPGEVVSGFYSSKDEGCCSSDWRHHSSSSWDVSHLGLEENRPCPHLLPGLSPALDLLAGLTGRQLLSYFHRYVALSQVEEVRQVLWLSVVLYTSPETELTCCLLLSTDSIYFLLEDCPSILGHHSVLDLPHSGDSDTCLCCCLSIKLCELQGINVGLFDQYFRVVGSSANHVVSCLSRDSYRTSVFLQELMSVLSNQQHLPPPEPSEQDFYSQFTHTNSGKMQNYELIHSSRVKFVYPSDEEMGDLTFIVAERKTSPSSSWSSCNILLYLLVFQVQTFSQGPALSGASSSPVLHPRTLILTSTDVFLLDEDYVSYPLPDFAKEPPSRERYQLREARRIRDLDRVLLGYQTYPQALTLVFDDLPGPDLLCHLTMDHFSMNEGGGASKGGVVSRSPEGEVQWCVFVPGADGRERLIALLARQWEALCSRELPVELTG